MEILSLEFFTALFAIIVIDLVLAGDNAIVIALAARSLPPHLQRQAVIWGAVGAVVVRSAMTLVVVWLLKVPGLLLVGGTLLIWIAYRLLLPEKSDGDGDKIAPAVGFWGAIQTIVIADMVMGLDNVLAVAGAAQGSYLLVVLGLLISVPIVVWGSTLLLRWVERFPAIVYFGAGVLAWTAVKMLMSEPFVRDAFGTNIAAITLVYLIVIGGVLWTGFVKNHRRLESRISSRLAVLAKLLQADGSHVVLSKGENVMQKILVPIDGSRNSEHALKRVVSEFRNNPQMEIHLLNVQRPFSRHISQFIGRKTRHSFHHEEAEKVLQPAKQHLSRVGVPYAAHIVVGHKANVIVEQARILHCDRIVMSTARKSSLTRMLEDSTTNQVLERTTVPVEIVSGDAISKVERYGVPAGLGALIALMFAAVMG